MLSNACWSSSQLRRSIKKGRLIKGRGRRGWKQCVFGGGGGGLGIIEEARGQRSKGRGSLSVEWPLFYSYK